MSTPSEQRSNAYFTMSYRRPNISDAITEVSELTPDERLRLRLTGRLGELSYSNASSHLRPTATPLPFFDTFEEFLDNATEFQVPSTAFWQKHKDLEHPGCTGNCTFYLQRNEDGFSAYEQTPEHTDAEYEELYNEFLTYKESHMILNEEYLDTRKALKAALTERDSLRDKIFHSMPSAASQPTAIMLDPSSPVPTDKLTPDFFPESDAKCLSPSFPFEKPNTIFATLGDLSLSPEPFANNNFRHFSKEFRIYATHISKHSSSKIERKDAYTTIPRSMNQTVNCEPAIRWLLSIHSGAERAQFSAGVTHPCKLANPCFLNALIDPTIVEVAQETATFRTLAHACVSLYAADQVSPLKHKVAFRELVHEMRTDRAYGYYARALL